MRRRELILYLGGTLAIPRRGRAQEKPPVVAILDPRAANPLVLAQVRQGLASLGYRDGQNVAVRFLGAGGRYDRLPALAAEAVRDGPSVIIAISVPTIHAAAKATASVPIVFMTGFDPVKQGLVASLNKPGGHLTGISMLTVGLSAKRLQMLRELVPGARKFGLLVNPDNLGGTADVDEIQSAARSLGCEIEIVGARTGPEIAAGFANLAKDRVGGLVVGNDPFLTSRRQQIVDLAARYRLPGVYEWPEYVEVGGLVSYGSSRAADYRTLGVYAGKILAGAKPADLPVVQPTTFELAINLKTAKALGLAVPPLLLAQADDVIQ